MVEVEKSNGNWKSVSFLAIYVLVATSIIGAMMNQNAVAADAVKYRKFTLYNADEGGLKDEVIIIFHGFKSAMPNGAYKRLHKAFHDRFSVVGFNYDYFDIKANEEAFALLWDKALKGRKIISAGTSLGGFWANHFAYKYNIKKVLVVNPVVDPVTQLQQFIGRHYVERRQTELIVTAEDLEHYRGIEIPVDESTSRLVLLSRDDEVLNYKRALEKYSGKLGNKVIVFDEGGHTLNLREPRFMDVIREFLVN